MNILDKVVLPSNGMMENVPKEVTIRDMKGRELSTLFSSLTDASIDNVISEVTDPSVDPDLLCDEDKKFILHKTRELTFGNTVDQTLRCPFCSKIHNYTIDYNDLSFDLLDEDKFNETIEMPDGNTITKKVPSKLDWDKIHRYKEKRNLPESYSYILLQVARINTINGKKKSLGEIIAYLENLPAKDLRNLTDKLELKFGLDTTFIAECKSCKTDFPGGIGINADLFR